MKETRVEKYAEYRREIEALDKTGEISNKDNKKSISKTNTNSYSVDEILKKHDEYTIMFNASNMNEKNYREEQRKIKERKTLIGNIVLYSVLGLIVIAIVVIIITLLGGVN